MTTKDGKTFYTRAEAARALGISKRTIDRLRAGGKLKPQRAAIGRGRGGTRVYFDAAEIEALRAGAFSPAEVKAKP